MKKAVVIILIVISFFLGIRWKSFWYLDQCLDIGGGINPGNHPICVIEK